MMSNEVGWQLDRVGGLRVAGIDIGDIHRLDDLDVGFGAVEGGHNDAGVGGHVDQAGQGDGAVGEASGSADGSAIGGGEAHVGVGQGFDGRELTREGATGVGCVILDEPSTARRGGRRVDEIADFEGEAGVFSAGVEVHFEEVPDLGPLAWF